jgi:hypothetical protein
MLAMMRTHRHISGNDFPAQSCTPSPLLECCSEAALRFELDGLSGGFLARCKRQTFTQLLGNLPESAFADTQSVTVPVYSPGGLILLLVCEQFSRCTAFDIPELLTAASAC